MKKTDTLWMVLTDTRKKFSHGMEEIEERKTEMDSQLQRLKFAKSADLNEEEKSTLSQYNSIFRAYRPLAGKYKEVVLHTEDIFFRVKTLEKSVRNGEYDNKLEEFKKNWSSLNTEMRKNLEEATEIDEKLVTLEPTYQRLAPKVEEILERLDSE